jgi:uracil-DNA glycosylase family 4
MIPSPGCTACALSCNRKRIVSSSGNNKADVLFIVDAVNGTDELLGSPAAGPDSKLLRMLLHGAGGSDLSIHIVSVTMCRSHTNGVDRDPTPNEVLKCMKNILKIASDTEAKVVILIGDIAEKYYKREFDNAICLKPMWMYRKYPALGINAVTSIREAILSIRSMNG